jgi:zeta-carotene desaturase
MAAAAPFVRVLGGVLGPSPRDAAIGLPARPLAAIFGDPARRYLEARGSSLQLHAPARVRLQDGQVHGVESRGLRTSCRAVVAAVPWTAWRTLVDADEARAAGLEELRADALARTPSPIVSVNLWPDRTLLDATFLGLPGRTFQWAFARPMHSSRASAAPGHVTLVSSGAADIARLADDVLVERAWAELRTALPGARDARLTHTSVVREHHATFSLASGEPPRPPSRTAVGNLWLAGDWTDTGLPATIEGAIVSGHRAAVAVLESA